MKHKQRHRCLVYTGAPSQQLPAIGTILIEKLNAGYRCMYLNSPAMVTGLRSYLVAQGINLDEETERGALIITSDQSHLVDGHFEVDPMIGMIKAAVVRAQGEGFTGLWASGDMTWEFGGAHNVGKLLEYECKLEHLFHEQPGLVGICQYHMDTLPPDSIAEALYTHQEIFINETITKLNPNYIPPAEPLYKRSVTSPSHLNKMLEDVGLPAYPAIF